MYYHSGSQTGHGATPSASSANVLEMQLSRLIPDQLNQKLKTGPINPYLANSSVDSKEHSKFKIIES